MSAQSVSCLDAPPCDDHCPPQIGTVAAPSICSYTLGGRFHFSMAARRDFGRDWIEQRDGNDYLGEDAIEHLS